ncbi:MAG: HIT domain-containing protein, partial [Nanoarchaeota archaeon]|nr:HIT domain-containing protein [Nanoarchaeota archaeon]
LYEDEKILCVLPNAGVVPGHIQIYSKKEEKYIEKVSPEDSVYLFSAASICASLLFEAMKVQGTNLIVKSGPSDDNPDGKLCIHILPRKQDDSLQGLLWQPVQPKYNLDGVMEKIKDKMWKVKYAPKKEEPKMPVPEKKIIKIQDTALLSPLSFVDSKDEIRKAIDAIRGK